MQEELPNVYYAPVIKLMMVKEDDYKYGGRVEFKILI